MKKIVVVAPHPDDETLGCGGTLLKHKADDNKIHWLICTTLNKNNNYYQNREKEINRLLNIGLSIVVLIIVVPLFIISDVIPVIESISFSDGCSSTEIMLGLCTFQTLPPNSKIL